MRILDDVSLHFLEVTVVVGRMTREVDELVAEMAVKLDRKPFVVGAVVVNEELRGHLRVEERTVQGVTLALDGSHEGAAVWLREVADRGHMEEFLETGVGFEGLRVDAPVVAVVGVVVVLEEESLVGEGAEDLSVAGISYELERQTLMSEIHVLIWVSILGSEVGDALIAHAGAPHGEVGALIIHLDHLIIEEVSII